VPGKVGRQLDQLRKGEASSRAGQAGQAHGPPAVVHGVSTRAGKAVTARSQVAIGALRLQELSPRRWLRAPATSSSTQHLTVGTGIEEHNNYTRSRHEGVGH